jgi:hypothetical protein
MGNLTHIVLYSGGIQSFYTAVWLLNKIDPPSLNDVILLFADTKIEDEDLYRFNLDIENYFGKKITVLADGRTPWEVFKDVRFLGNSRVDHCSKILKRELCKNWVASKFTPAEVILYAGINWTESHRTKNISNFWSPYTVICPLLELENTKLVKSILGPILPIKLPRLYEMGFPHNNCGGFCIKAGKAHFANLWKHMPERFYAHAQKEKEMQEYLGAPYTILKERDDDKKNRYISLFELGARLEKEKLNDEEMFEWGGCGCFADFLEEELEK